MAKRKIRVRGRRPVKPEPEPEPELEPDEAEDYSQLSGEEDYSQWSLRELRGELRDRELESAGRKSVLIGRLATDDAGEVDTPKPEPEPEPEPKKGRRVRRVRKAEPADVPEPIAPAVSGTLPQLFELMTHGQTLTVIRVDADMWRFSAGGVDVAAEPKGKGLRGKAYAKEVLSEGYWSFDYEDCGNGKPWREMTEAEREEFAADMGVELDEERPKIRAMKLKGVILKELDIPKYKDEYKTKAARDAIR